MDWIHCNGCFIQPRTNSNPPKFFLTSCGHIFCERCSKTDPDKCRVCDAQCTTTVLSSQLREEVQDFFSDPDTFLNKAVKVLQYQNNHRDRLMGHLRKTSLKYDAAKREIQRLHDENKQLRKKVHVQQQEIAWFKLQRDRMRLARSSVVPPSAGSLPPSGLFSARSSSDSQRAALQHMRNSGLGNSRISMNFTTSTPRHSQQDPLSPLSVLTPSTPFPSQQYRSQPFATPENTPGGASSFVPDSPISLEGSFRHSQQSRRTPHSPPSRGTPSDALKILSLAYKNSKNP